VTKSLTNLIPQMIEEWEDMQDKYYPDRQQLYDFVVTLIPSVTGTEKVLELFTGSGSLSKRVLDRIPGTRITAVDFDDIMLDMARYNLRDKKEMTRLIKRDLRDPKWYEDLPLDFDAVISAHAFHLLPDNRKLRLYKDVAGLIREGGLFICLDEVKSSFMEFDKLCSRQLASIRKNSGIRELSEDWRDFWNRVGKRLGRENYARNLLKSIYPEGIDTMGTLPSQLDLLKKAGFGEVECFYRDISIVIYGGMKT